VTLIGRVCPVRIHVEDITGAFDEQYFELTVINEPADGDINLDGTVDISDVLLAQRIVNGDVTPTSQQFAHGDVAPLSGGTPAPDGVIDIADVLVIMRKATGLVSF
jgi:hypothetical protein